jgi:hypothetical protein
VIEHKTYSAKSPVKHANQDFDRGSDKSEVVLQREELVRGGYVGEETGGEDEGGDGNADYGEVLEVPAVGVVLGRGLVGVVIVGCDLGLADVMGDGVGLWGMW